jgi:hypothetical protein
MKRLLAVFAATLTTAALTMAPAAQAATPHASPTLAQLITQADQVVAWHLAHPSAYPNSLPQWPAAGSETKCKAGCLKIGKSIRASYDHFLKYKVCLVTTQYYCNHPLPIMQAIALVDACNIGKVCPKVIAQAIYQHYHWVHKHGGIRQLVKLWHCGTTSQPCPYDCPKHKPCKKAPTSWIGFVDFMGQLAQYGCALITGFVAGLICFGSVALVTTIFDQVMSPAKHKNLGADLFTKGLNSIGPFLVAYLKHVFDSKEAVAGDGVVP